MNSRGLAMVAANASLAERGVLTELPVPNYGYLGSSVILHERIDNGIYNGWVDGNLDELTYVDIQGGPKHMVIHMPTDARTKVCASIPPEVYSRSRGERRCAG